MKMNRGTAARTSSFMSPMVWSTTRQKTMPPSAKSPNASERTVSVAAMGVEQSFHEPALFQKIAHEDEQGHRGEDLLLHESDGLEHNPAEDHAAKREVPERQREDRQRRGYGRGTVVP